MGCKFVPCSTSLLTSLALLVLEPRAVVSATSTRLPTSPCPLPGVTQAARCGVLTVLENPERPDSRRLAIHFAVIPASSGKALAAAKSHVLIARATPRCLKRLFCVRWRH